MLKLFSPADLLICPTEVSPGTAEAHDTMNHPAQQRRTGQTSIILSRCYLGTQGMKNVRRDHKNHDLTL